MRFSLKIPANQKQKMCFMVRDTCSKQYSLCIITYTQGDAVFFNARFSWLKSRFLRICEIKTRPTLQMSVLSLLLKLIWIPSKGNWPHIMALSTLKKSTCAPKIRAWFLLWGWGAHFFLEWCFTRQCFPQKKYNSLYCSLYGLLTDLYIKPIFRMTHGPHLQHCRSRERPWLAFY